MKTARRLIVLAIVAVCISLLCLGQVSAKEYGGPAAARERDRIDDLLGRYSLQPAFRKLGRGVANFLAGWMEIPLGVDSYASKADTAGSFFTGIAVGIFKGLVRTGVGAYETVTFLLPYPEDYAPVLPTLAYFNKTHKRKRLPLE